MTKAEEKRLIDFGWEKEKDGFINSKEEWIKECLLFPVMYTRQEAFTQLCIGIFVYDEYLNELHLLHFNDKRFFELTNDPTFFNSNSTHSAEVLFDRCDKKIKKKTFKVKDLYQDKRFFSPMLSDIIYVPYERNMSPDPTSVSYEICFIKPDLQDPNKYMLSDMQGWFVHSTMIHLDEDEIIYKKYKLNENANK